MFINDALFSKVGDPITMGVLFYLVSVADNEGNVYMSSSDIGNALGYPKIRVYRCIQKLVALGAINILTCINRNASETQVKRKRNANCVINICNINAYKKGETLMKRNRNASETQNDTKEIKEQPVKTTKIERYFEDETMNDAITKWLAYKKEKKQTYKPRGLETLKTKLLNLSNGDGKAAMLIVEQSMANNYSGLFPLKESVVSHSNLPVGMNLQNSNNDERYKLDSRWNR